MTQARDTHLNNAFEATDYFVHAGGEWQQINIGSAVPQALSRWLADNCDTPCAWLITAHNPRAETIDEQSNQRQDAALKAALDCAGHRYVAANSRAHDDAWPDEPGVCIVDMNEGLARALALRFEQTAMVAVPIHGQPQLVWVEP